MLLLCFRAMFQTFKYHPEMRNSVSSLFSVWSVSTDVVISLSLNPGGHRGTTDDIATIHSILPCIPLPSGNLQTPLPSISWCYLPISSSVFLSLLLSLSPAEFSLPCQRILRCGHTIWVSVSLLRLDHHALQLHSVANLLVRHMVFVGNVQRSPIAHLKGLDPSLDFCCQCPALTGIKEGG